MEALANSLFKRQRNVVCHPLVKLGERNIVRDENILTFLTGSLDFIIIILLSLSVRDRLLQVLEDEPKELATLSSKGNHRRAWAVNGKMTALSD